MAEYSLVLAIIIIVTVAAYVAVGDAVASALDKVTALLS